MGSSEPAADASSSEEWQDWMDWSKASGEESRNAHQLRVNGSPKSAHQLPSPQSSTISDPPGLGPRKRRLSPEHQQQPDGTSHPCDDKAKAHNKSHSIVEKRYRTNLNQKISDLGDCIPNLSVNAEARKGGLEGLKRNKATILTEAIAYIKELECRNKYLEETNEALHRCGQSEIIKSIHDETPKPEEKPSDAIDPPITRSSASVMESLEEPTTGSQAHGAKPARGLIQVPDEWRRMWRGELRTLSRRGSYSRTQTADAETGAARVPGTKKVKRLMLGSIAGLMVADSFNGGEKGNDKQGLSSIPLFRHIPRSDHLSNLFRAPSLHCEFMTAPSSNLCGSFFGAFLLFGFLGLLLFIYLFTSRPPSRRKSSSSTPKGLQPAPSVTSPLEVRQRAFLTAIQTIWFPRHHALPEMLALNVETAAYIIRQLLGWRTYSWLTGRSEDEEIARVRAWDIAIDAQLSGGDPEVSKSRLVLSLWASGSLPSSPARFMLKALHIRILFWQPSRWLWLNEQLHAIARALARWQWNKGQRLQLKHEESDAAVQVHGDCLTDHLRSLLSQSSDGVMNDTMLQKAHKMAWNNTISGRSCSDSMHEDTAMRGPLDALSSWCSYAKMMDGLGKVMRHARVPQEAQTLQLFDVSHDLAPPASVHRVRVLAAKAVLSESKWSQNLHDLFATTSPGITPDQLLTSKILLGEAKSFSEEIPPADAIDIHACVLASVGIHAQHEGLDVSHELKHLLTNDGEAMGLLGWMAVRHMFLLIPPKILLDEGPHRVSEILNTSEALDASSKLLAQQAFKNLQHQSNPSTRQGRRRTSGSSHDTGYESMDEEEEKESHVL